MPRFKTFAHGGTLIPADINRLVTEINASMLPWRTIYSGGTNTMTPGFDEASMDQRIAPGTMMILGTWIHLAEVTGGTFPVAQYGTDNEDQGSAEYGYLIYLNPQDYGVRTGRLRWRVQLICAGDPVNSYGAAPTVALYPVTSVLTHVTNEFGYMGYPSMQASAVPVAGSYFTMGPPPTGQGKLAFSNAMPMPPVGDYVAALSVSNAPNNGVQLLIKAELQFRPEKIS